MGQSGGTFRHRIIQPHPVGQDVVNIGLDSGDGRRKEIPEAGGGQVLQAGQNRSGKVVPVDEQPAHFSILELAPEPRCRPGMG